MFRCDVRPRTASRLVRVSRVPHAGGQRDGALANQLRPLDLGLRGPANDRRGEAIGVSYAVPVIDPARGLRGVWDVDFDTLALAGFLRTNANDSNGYGFVVESLPGGEWQMLAHPQMESRREPDGKIGALVASPLDPVVGALLKSVPRKLWENYGVHAERGNESVNHVVKMVAGHDLNHIRQLQALAER